jgi:hypothetical protein
MGCVRQGNRLSGRHSLGESAPHSERGVAGVARSGSADGDGEHRRVCVRASRHRRGYHCDPHVSPHHRPFTGAGHTFHSSTVMKFTLFRYCFQGCCVYADAHVGPHHGLVAGGARIIYFITARLLVALFHCSIIKSRAAVYGDPHIAAHHGLGCHSSTTCHPPPPSPPLLLPVQLCTATRLH